MFFSILIPTFNNFDYLKLTINSIKKNSTFKHEIIVHINGKCNKTENFLNNLKIKYSNTLKNIGLCSSVNQAFELSTKNYIVYSHDDMYFLPKWDSELISQLKKINTNKFYLSSTQLSPNKYNEIINSKKKDYYYKANHIYYNAGSKINNFDENKLLKNFNKKKFYDLQGSHWAPHVIEKSMWKKIGGFSEEFDPGFGSDPDLNMKLWKEGVRIFKSVNKSRVYHFGSLTTRKNLNIQKNNGRKTFLLKWKISINFFTKYYLRRGDEYKVPLLDFSLNKNNCYALILDKIKYFFLKIL